MILPLKVRVNVMALNQILLKLVLYLEFDFCWENGHRLQKDKHNPLLTHDIGNALNLLIVPKYGQ